MGQAEFGLGVGGGWVSGVSRNGLDEEIFVERVYQVGPLVLVFGSNDWAFFVTNEIAVGLGVIAGARSVTWTWDLQSSLPINSPLG